MKLSENNCVGCGHYTPYIYNPSKKEKIRLCGDCLYIYERVSQ